ncbi:hypothetical protein [Paenibacillus crassostreae]|uniref:Uncharacterized protein n=1 Tax=Paenibacillus crassostreae TaxID=1763538 RepID=A0A162RKZ2_9BACL|nr:hypothetical protein [Paenibacillus crassostreae]AOZ91598.1 hypothetical protein LPB68_04790 [Paenibacillus crassostreae]OAB72827.1 hypothetical protein PNBC_15460 [Paenibacillus crassostreae]
MKEITKRHLDFLEEAKMSFENDVRLETHRNEAEGLIALRRSFDRDCVQVYELGDEVALFAKVIPATVGTEFIESIGNRYGLKLGEVRTEIAEFSEEMEKQLKANVHKGGWENYTYQYLRNELEKNFRKLMKRTSHSEFRRRCANIANFAMMLADNDRREERERL